MSQFKAESCSSSLHFLCVCCTDHLAVQSSVAKLKLLVSICISCVSSGRKMGRRRSLDILIYHKLNK